MIRLESGPLAIEHLHFETFSVAFRILRYTLRIHVQCTYLLMFFLL